MAKYIYANIFAKNLILSTQNTSVAGQLGGVVYQADGPNHRNRYRQESLSATLSDTRPAESCQDFGAIANDDATSGDIGEIHGNISAVARSRWKNDTVDTL